MCVEILNHTTNVSELVNNDAGRKRQAGRQARALILQDVWEVKSREKGVCVKECGFHAQSGNLIYFGGTVPKSESSVHVIPYVLQLTASALQMMHKRRSSRFHL